MCDSSLFIGAALPWLRRINENGAQEVFQRLDRVLRQNNRDLEDAEVIVRPNHFLDARRELVMASAEPLMRWDERPPSQIFGEGFRPRIEPSNLEEFRRLDDNRVNIATYTYDNQASIFVSTTRYVMSDGRIAQFHPEDYVGMYEYEIYVYGGIDINLTLRPRHNMFPYEHEVAFPGGIRPDLIRSARQYDEHWNVVRVWRNLHFRPEVNGAYMPRVDLLPPLPDVVPPSNYDVVDPPDDNGEDSGHNHDELLHLNETGVLTTEVCTDDDIKKYKLAVDPWAAQGVRVFPLARTCLAIDPTSDAYRAYFFADTRFVLIDFTRDEKMTDTIGAGGVQSLVTAFPALHKACFPQIDAAVRSKSNREDAYFISGDMYVRIKLKGDKIVSGPHRLKDQWNSLRDAGFNSVDAILPNYDDNGQSYVFSGTQYMKMEFDGNRNDYDKLIGRPRKITDGWQALKEVGFDRIDAVLPSPHKKGDVYFFKGEEYVLVRYTWGRDGDKALCKPRHVADWWPSLARARFY
ncbi:Hemopexin domain-containing [Pyrrhoderma noxium]|uniref:Hemopexin domain-containing n=1 Tax=Pyrrhoderma noxium TaxID=2282107 RepID=A0A286UD82_9AGAM|nr:Hemopexin domain-containing [Pyrrhoderma noxium]